MSFEHASVSKGLMMACALTSITAGVFDVKHYLHLQLVPHLSRHHQYWRLLTHHLAFSNSSDLFLAELLLYVVGVNIERQLGSFTIVSGLLSTLLEFMALILLHRIGVNHIPGGPSAIVFSMLYQWYRLVPVAYHFRIFGVPLSNKAFTYALALQLALGHVPGSLVSSCVGLLVGYIYHFLLPLVGSTRPPRRFNRARPEQAHLTTEVGDEEVITTAPPSVQRSGRPTGEGTEGSSVVREWVNELTGRTGEAATRIRTPSEVEITQLTSMFPDTSRDVIVTTLQQR
ncbi:hypothetical protein EDD15DRAFT_2512486 [Pisolithus albus]|nr:hypothetical protein EDD15DRAFT_2512486 [Pisolithus albus]